MRETILTVVTDHYISSGDFNGLPARVLIEQLGEQCTPILEELIREGMLSLNSGNYHPNPHIKALGARPVEEQIATVRERGLGAACIYPERGHLEQDQVPMQIFGFCFDDEQSCYVAAFIRYLTNLSPEHQQYWSTLEVDRATRLHPVYFRPTILDGNRPDGRAA